MMSKLVPKLRFKEFSGDWENKTLENLSNITMGSSPKSSFYNKNKEGVPLLQGNADIKNRKSYPRIYTTQITKECFENDILLSVRAPVGTVAKSNHYACIGRGISSIKAKKDNSQEWIYQWFLQFENRWSSISQGGTFEAVNSSDIKNLNILIPKLEEQEKIAKTLTSLDNFIEVQNKKVETLKKHKKGLMQKLFPLDGEKKPKLRFDGFSGDWEEKRLGDIVKVFKGKGISKNDIIENGRLECIRYGELYTYYREIINDIKSKTNLNEDNLILSKKNDIIIPSSGETSIDIAIASCVTKDNIALGGDLNILRGKENGIFLAYYLSNAKKYEIAKLAQGIAVIHLYASQLINLNLKLPSIDEQQKIAETLTSLDNLIEAQTKKVETLKQHKKGLMQKLFVNKEEN